MLHFTSKSLTPYKSFFRGLFLSISIVSVGSAMEGSELTISKIPPLTQEQMHILEVYETGKKELLLGNVKTASLCFEEAKNKGHVPSEICLLEMKKKDLRAHYKRKKAKKKALLKGLHENEKLVQAKKIFSYEKKMADLSEHITSVYEEIYNIENFQSINSDFFIKDASSDYFFIEDPEEDAADLKENAEKLKVKRPTLNEYYATKMATADDYFELRVKTNARIRNKLTVLMGHAGCTTSKKMLGFLQATVASEIAKNERKVAAERKRLSTACLNRQDMLDKLDYLEKSLGIDNYRGVCKDAYKLTPVILEFLGNCAKVENFLSPQYHKFLKKALDVICEICYLEDSLIDYDDQEDYMRIMISDKFINSHDTALAKKNIPFEQKLEMAMASIYFASKQLQAIDYHHSNMDEDVYAHISIFQNTINSIEGKYISWFLDQRYQLYEHLLFKGVSINKDLLTFYHYAQKLKDLIGDSTFGRIILVLKKTNSFQLPIVQERQIIYVHSHEPYVLRLKKDMPQYTIGLIKSPYTLSINSHWFYRTNDLDVGNCYKMDHDLMEEFNYYPEITDQDNELLKLTFLRPYDPDVFKGGNNSKTKFKSMSQGKMTPLLLTSYGTTIPAGIIHANGWRPGVDLVEKQELLKDAHFKYN